MSIDIFLEGSYFIRVSAKEKVKMNLKLDHWFILTLSSYLQQYFKSNLNQIFKIQPKYSYGLTVIELLVVVAIIGLLVSIAIPNYTSALYKSEVAKAIGDINFLENEIMIYRTDYGKFPDSLADIGRENFLDPWGNTYRYLNFENVKGKGQMRKDRYLVPLNSDYDLYSVGRDGKTSTALTAKISQDDVVRANDGGFIGLGKDY